MVCKGAFLVAKTPELVKQLVDAPLELGGVHRLELALNSAARFLVECGPLPKPLAGPAGLGVALDATGANSFLGHEFAHRPEVVELQVEQKIEPPEEGSRLASMRASRSPRGGAR